jgi:hypothetical protein
VLLHDIDVKVRLQSLAEDPEMRGRFEQEARTVLVLDDPHVRTVHDVGVRGVARALGLGERRARGLARAGVPRRLHHAGAASRERQGPHDLVRGDVRTYLERDLQDLAAMRARLCRRVGR